VASIQFDGNNNTMAVPDGNTFLNRSVQNPPAMSDGAKANIGIATKVGGLTTYNTGSGTGATHRVNTTQVQLRAPTGLVKVAGFEVTPEVAQTLTEAAPEMFVDPSVKAAEAALEADKARSEEATREDLNRHPDDQIEAAHQHFVGEVSQQNQIALMVYAHKGEAPSADLLKTIADEMHVPLHEAIDKVNAISMGTQAQFTVLARSMNLDADKAADWIREHRRDTAMVAAQAHGLRRDLLAWKPLLEDYRMATGDGRKH
jgi:hypothetical protein